MKKTITLIVTLILLIIAILGIIFISQISAKPNFEGTKEFTITKGENVNQISQNLLEQGLIKSKFAFKSYLYIKKLETSVQAGTYLLTPMSIVEIVEILVSGRVDNESNVKIIEGWDLEQIAELLNKQMLIKNENEFFSAAKVKNFKDKYSFLENHIYL